MDLNVTPIATLKICVVSMIPLFVCVIWLLPKFFISKSSTKIMTGAIMVSVFALMIVSLVGNSTPQIQNIKFVTTLTALIWGIVGFYTGAYFDVRLRVKLGSKYYQEFLRLRMYGVECGIVGAIISLPLGIVIGWIVTTFRASTVGIFFSIIIGAFFGGLIGWILDRVIAKKRY